MFIILYFVGAILVYSAARSMVEAARLLPIEIIEREKNIKMASPLKFGLSILPFVVAYLLYEQYPRFAWQIIFVVLVIAAVEFVLVYYAAIKKLKNGGYPPDYVVKMRRGFSLAGLGLVILMSSSVSVLFK
jgi:hypothetical protein